MEQDPNGVPIFLQNAFLLQHLQGGVVYSDFDPPFHLRYASAGLAHMSGYTQEELISMEQMDIVWDEDVERLSADVAQQLAIGDIFAVEYRLKRKDGTHLYVLDRAKVAKHSDGKKYIHCLLTDITDLKRMEQGLRLSEEKYKLAIQQSGSVILEYDLNTKVVRFSENFADVFCHEAPTSLFEGNWIAPQYRDKVDALLHNVLCEQNSASIEILVHAANELYIWVLLTLTPVVVSDGTIHALVGCLQNIDKHKREVEMLTERSQKDGLTNIYNRVTMENMITAQLTTSDHPLKSALIIMDIDFFKLVNDNFGHATGDRILICVSQEVAAQLPPNTLFGRLGGDEFLIFTQTDRNESLEQLCAHIVEVVRATFANDVCPITVSLGGAQCSSSPCSFHKLYRSADIALYETKNHGRNSYTIFSPSLYLGLLP